MMRLNIAPAPWPGAPVVVLSAGLGGGGGYWLAQRAALEEQYQLVDELTPQEGDIVLPKPRYSGFFNTPLDSILRSRGIRHLVFTGIATNVCVESTLRDGFFLEYFGIVLEDATHQAGPAFAQQAALFNIETFFGWVSDVESFCHALSPAAPLALAKEKRYA